MFADDFVYSRIPASAAFERAWEMYFTWGGRILGHAWMVYIHSLPVVASSCIVALCLCLLFATIHLLTYGDKWKNNLSLAQLALPVTVFWFFLPEAWETTLWKTGAFYTVAAFSACVFLLPFRFMADGKNCFHGKAAAFSFIVFSFITPFWVEVIIAPTLFLAAVSLFLFPRFCNAWRWPWAACAALLIGSAATLAAPGNFARADLAASFDAAVFVRTIAALIFKYGYAVAAPAGIFFCLAAAYGFICKAPDAKRLWTVGGALFIASLLSVALLAGGGAASYRAIGFAFILMLIAMNAAYAKTSSCLPALKALPLLMITSAVPSAALACVDYANLNTADRQRSMDVAALKQKGEKVVFLKELPSVRRGNFFFLDALRGNPLPWGEAFSAKHGLENAYLLMDESPENLVSAAVRKWEGALQITPSILLRSILVVKRNGHNVLALTATGETENIKELVFFTAAGDSPVKTRLAQYLLPSSGSPEIIRSRAQLLLGELLDRTVLVPAPNTRMEQGDETLFYGKQHPLAGRALPMTVMLKIRTHDAAETVRAPF